MASTCQPCAGGADAELGKVAAARRPAPTDRGTGPASPAEPKTCWRRLGAEALQLSGVEDVPVEGWLHVQLPPWTDLARVTFNLSMGSGASHEFVCLLGF